MAASAITMRFAARRLSYQFGTKYQAVRFVSTDSADGQDTNTVRPKLDVNENKSETSDSASPPQNVRPLPTTKSFSSEELRQLDNNERQYWQTYSSSSIQHLSPKQAEGIFQGERHALKRPNRLAKRKPLASDVGEGSSIMGDWLNGNGISIDMLNNPSTTKHIKPPKRALRVDKPLRQKQGLMNMGTKRGSGEDIEDPEFEYDDISAMAHGDLDQTRELREYARIAAWEMPLLSPLAKPFEPPTAKEVLRFRYTTYMGEEHPAETKVVVEFCPSDMPDLTTIQKEKLKKLVGARYNPEKDIIKMSCEMFETQAQNKRYLGDQVDTLLREARDPQDDFADIPLDLRHHEIKIKPKFPKEWRMSPERRAEIEAFRQQALLEDEQKQTRGLLIDGVSEIQQAFAKIPSPSRGALAEMAMVGKGKAKGGKKLSGRR